MSDQTARLGDLCEVVRGGSPRPKGDPRYFGGDIPWVTIRDVTRADTRFLRRTAETVTEAGRERSRYIEPGQLIVSNSATVGLPIFMGIGGCIHDGFLTFLNVDPKLTLDWLYWYFVSARRRLVEMAPEGTQKNLNTELVENLRIPLPSPEHQVAHAETLARADDLRRKHRYAVQLGTSLIDATFQELFREKLAQPPTRRLEQVATITGGGTPSRGHPEYFNGAIPWATPKDMRGDYIWKTQERVTEEGVASSATKLVPKESILVVVKSKVLAHRLPVAIAKVPLCHGQDIKSIQVGEGMHPEFVRYLLRHHERHLLSLARGANTEGLTLPMLTELPVPDVCCADQERFAEFVRRSEAIRSGQREALRQSDHLVLALLSSTFVSDTTPRTLAQAATA